MNLTKDEYKKLRDEAEARASYAFENLNDIMEKSFSDNASMIEINDALKVAEIWTNIFFETIREEACALSGGLEQIYVNPRYNGETKTKEIK